MLTFFNPRPRPATCRSFRPGWCRSRRKGRIVPQPLLRADRSAGASGPGSGLHADSTRRRVHRCASRVAFRSEERVRRGRPVDGRSRAGGLASGFRPRRLPVALDRCACRAAAGSLAGGSRAGRAEALPFQKPSPSPMRHAMRLWSTSSASSSVRPDRCGKATPAPIRPLR